MPRSSAMFARARRRRRDRHLPRGPLARRGAARAAQDRRGAARARWRRSATGTPIPIVPCGLTFIHPKRFRSRVLVQFGPPIDDRPAENEPTQSAADRPRSRPRLRRLTINAPDWDTVRALDVVRRLYQPQEISIEERVELARRFNAYYGAVAADPRVVELMHARARVPAQARRARASPTASSRAICRSSRSRARMLRHLVLVACWLPLTLPGAPLHVPPLVFARYRGAAADAAQGRHRDDEAA